MKRYINSKTGASVEVPETMAISGDNWNLDVPDDVEEDMEDNEEDISQTRPKGRKKA